MTAHLTSSAYPSSVKDAAVNFHSVDSPSLVQRYTAALAADPQREDLRILSNGDVAGRFLRCEIASVFQPILSLKQGGFSSWQALACVHSEGGSPLLPWDLFAMAAQDEELVLLDRRCRIVHTLNFFRLADADSELLLNVHERLLTAVSSDHGRAFRRVLESLSIDPRRIVIALPPLAEGKVDLHCQAVASYRLNGFRVVATSTEPQLLLQLLNRIPPDALRLDVRDLNRPGIQSLMARTRASSADIPVHVTRVETETQRGAAIAAGATHLQGYLIGHPAPLVVT